ncbi:MAG: hypothetical protein GC192_18755 [Bacteroidetes bacterium]|nr:hypothetical protein [Bacteroidota bacterium]
MDQPVIVLPLFYCPPVMWFKAVANASKVYLEQNEHYVKGSYRNRCIIAAVNGPHRLSVPLRKGKNQQQGIRDVRIAYDEPWQIRHWRAICTAYGNSPFFEHYSELYAPFFTKKKYEFLWDWNYDLLMVSMKILKLNTPILLTEQYEVLPEGKTDLRNNFEQKNSSQRTEKESVRYPQVFEDRLGFIQNLSILDLIFCAGRLNI